MTEANSRRDAAANLAFEAVAASFADDPEITSATMFGSSGLKVRGKVFAMLVKGALVLKLPPERIRGLLGSGSGVAFDPGHGRPMKEWIALAPEHTRRWPALVRAAREYVSAPTPKGAGPSAAPRTTGRSRRL